VSKWRRCVQLEPGDLTSGFTDVPPADAAPPSDDRLRLLCSASTVGEAGLARRRCYTLCLHLSNGKLEPLWFEPWLERTACYVMANGHAQ
jgi:hypothetical protein